jgi:hypothetical protein
MLPKCKEFAGALLELIVLEATLEKWRKTLAQRASFNLKDAYRLLI